MDVDVGIGVKGTREAQEQFAALNRMVASLYAEGLNTRQPVENARVLTRSLNALGREIRDIATPALSGLGITLGLGAGALAGSLIGIAAKTREFAHATVEIGYIAQETGVSIEMMKGYAAAASSHGISNEAAMQSLQQFAKHADDIRLQSSDLRATMIGWGEGRLVEAITGAKTNGEALAATLKRIDELRDSQPGRARFLSENLLGDYKFINMSIKEVERWAAMSRAPSKEAEEAARKFNATMSELDDAFDDLKQELGVAVLPGFTKAMQNLEHIYTDDPGAFDPLVKGLQQIALQIAQLSKRDWSGAGRGLGRAVDLALKSISTVYRALQWAANNSKMEEPDPRSVYFKTRQWHGLGLTLYKPKWLESLTGGNKELPSTTETTKPIKDVGVGLEKTKTLLAEINARNEFARRLAGGGSMGGMAPGLAPIYTPGGNVVPGSAARPGGYSVKPGGPAANIDGKPSPAGGPQVGFDPASAKTLAEQREPYAKYLDQHPEVKARLAALLVSEEPSRRGRTGTAETLFNRMIAHGVPPEQMASSVEGLRSGPGVYYEPLRPGGTYGRSVGQLNANPQLMKETLEDIDKAVKGGSNVSNYGTQNASAGVAARARELQTITQEGVKGVSDTWSRKDVHPEEHGAGTVRKESDWYASTKAAEAAAKTKASAATTQSAATSSALASQRSSLPGYMLDSAIRDEDKPLASKLHINVKVNSPKGMLDVKTNAQGGDIASVSQTRDAKPPKEPQPVPQKATANGE